MTESKTSAGIRIWPGVAIVLIQWLMTFGSGLVAPGTMIQFFGMMAGPLGGLLLLILWWLFGSRVPRSERLLAVGLIAVALAGAFFLAHPSTPMAIVIYGIPILCLAFVVWAYFTRAWTIPRRRYALIATVLLAAGFWTLVRSKGVDGDMAVDFAPRWSSTAEEEFLATVRDEEAGLAGAGGSVTVTATPVWPGFRGAGRDGVISGVQIETDWVTNPPQELWRRAIGPGWSSFALAGDLLYTQEQRGDEEIVACYRASSGEPVWLHRDPARFWEAMAGAGPRATPTLYEGKVFALGATGLLNVLDAESGSVLWQRDVTKDTGAKVPEWGFSSSPLVVDGRVVVHTGAEDGKAVVAYDLESGEPRWFAPAGPLSYSSPHLTTLAGVRQLVLLTSEGASGIAPADGAVLWEHSWSSGGGARVVQPAFTDDGGVLIGTGFGMGLRNLSVALEPGGWKTSERWTSTRLKPYYNDLVVHGDHVYGFDGRILTCLDLAEGKRAWKGGRYGNGQLVLLADQDLLLVLSDRGEVALVAADPSGFQEIARMPAIEGKTWNHPVLAEGVLYVRNGEEMAAFRLSIKPVAEPSTGDPFVPAG